jgi:RNA polymerase sigma-70 factor, ECF subfamily
VNEDDGKPGSQRDDSDEQLMTAFARGSAEAFDTLFARYRQPLYGFFCRRLPDRGHAEELTQETFLAILRARERYEPTALFRTYLYAIALRILRAWRRKAAFRAVFTGQLPEGREPSARDSTDASIVLREAVHKLDSIDREVLLLREFEELSYIEIATVLRIPLNTVRSRLFRARTALRELLTVHPAPRPTELINTEEHA